MLTKQKHKAIIGVVILLFSVTAWLFMRPSEPTYDGETLTHWIALLGTSDSDEEAHAFAAIQLLGANAVPIILQLLESRDSTFKFRCLQLAGRVPFLNLQFKTAADWREKAEVAFILVGEDSQRASIPTLVRLSHDADPGVRLTAIKCLSLLTFSAPEVLPSLEAAQNDADPQVAALARDRVRGYWGVQNGIQRLLENHGRLLGNHGR